MKKPLRALIVEDSESDAELLLRELGRAFDVTWVRVDEAGPMAAALEAEEWDVVLSDYSMPQFDAPSALRVMRAKELDLPFIIVSGTVGEEVAVEAMRAGVHDYVLKDKMGPRLIAAIEREMREAAVRSERRKMQQQLMISDRMASMGMLAAGAAHEINNPLAAVMVNIELTARALRERASEEPVAPKVDDLLEGLGDAMEAAHRIRNIVRDLKIFSRSQEDQKGLVDVQRVMESTLRMAWNEIRHRARLVKRYGKTPLVHAGESRLGQVFLNLVANAAQAIAEGSAQDNEIRISTSLDPSGRVVIEIADTGPGMTPEVLSRLFQPFFTTKPIGVGTGLGLSICHRIVTDLGGSIEVKSQIGKGTVVTVSLPPAPAGDQTTTPPPVPEAVPPRRGKLLIVDDDVMAGRALQRALTTEHDVVVTTSAADALRLIAQGDRFDVILSDLMMPQMTGMDFHAELLARAPEQAARMVFLTAGAFTSRAREFLDRTPLPRLDKPFEIRELRALIDARLRETSQRDAGSVK